MRAQLLATEKVALTLSGAVIQIRQCKKVLSLSLYLEHLFEKTSGRSQA